MFQSTKHRKNFPIQPDTLNLCQAIRAGIQLGCCPLSTSTALPGQSAIAQHFSLLVSIHLEAEKSASKLRVIGYVCQ
jgi:hypothetical protein